MIGYFGKNSSLYTQKIQELAQTSGTKQSLIKIHDQNLTLYTGVSKLETHCADPVISLASDQGIIAGKLFTKDTYEQIYSFDDKISAKLINDPAVLTNKYWGRYAAVLYNKKQ